MKNKKRCQAGLAACFGLLLATVSQAEPYSPSSGFELGQDAQPGTAAIIGSGESGTDWNDIFDANGQLRPDSGVSQAVFMKDDVSMGTAVDLTALADSDILIKNGVVATDQDIGNVYTALVPDSDDKMAILGGVERLGDGDGYMTLEFNKDSVGLGAGGFGKDLPWEMTGSRTEGDILLKLNFADGYLASAEVSRWAGAPDTGSYQQVGILSNEGCNEEGTLCALSNDQDIQAGPWLNADPNEDTATIPAHRFVEFKINAGALVEQPVYTTVCALTSEDMVFDALKGGN